VNRFSFSSDSWEGFLNLGGIAGGNPDCTFWKPVGEVACFAKAIDGSIYVTAFAGKNWVGGDWSTYSNLQGLVNDNASCTSQAAGELVCGVIGQSNPGHAFYANVFNGTNWSTWALVGGGGTGFGSPSRAPLGSGKGVCVIMGLNNKLTSVVGPKAITVLRRLDRSVKRRKHTDIKFPTPTACFLFLRAVGAEKQGSRLRRIIRDCDDPAALEMTSPRMQMLPPIHFCCFATWALRKSTPSIGKRLAAHLSGTAPAGRWLIAFSRLRLEARSS
jgi:hypothetical protein